MKGAAADGLSVARFPVVSDQDRRVGRSGIRGILEPDP
jgi:hypothetical protein